MSMNWNNDYQILVIQSSYSIFMWIIYPCTQCIYVHITKYIGYSVGYKQLELMTYRVNNGRRHRDVIGMLEFIKDKVWKHLFGRTADGLEQSTRDKDQFFIIDHNPITNRYVSVPDHLGDFNPASFIAGIIHGVLDGAGFPCTVTAHQQLPSKQQPKKRTVFIVKLQPKKTHGAWIK